VVAIFELATDESDSRHGPDRRNMSNEDREVAIPEDEQSTIEMVAEDPDELTDEEKNLIVAQAHLIGDI
jgi:hypothetical protein